jgi:hypothetical protein
VPKVATQDTASIFTSQDKRGNLSLRGVQSARRKKTAVKDSWKLMLSKSAGLISRMMIALKAKGCSGSVLFCFREKMVRSESIRAALTSETGIPATKA